MRKENFDFFSKMPDIELITFRIQIEQEMQRRNLRFSVGEIGEKLAINYFNSTRGLPTLIAAPPGAKNVDALSREGDRYSIKTIQKAKKTGTVYPDDQNKEKQIFEYLLIIQLDVQYQLNSIHRFTWEQFSMVRHWDKRMNAWYVPVSVNCLALSETLFRK